MDHLVAEDTDDALHAEHDQHPGPERDPEKHRQRLAPEQSDQRVPRDRRDPLQRRGNDDCPTESHACVGQLPCTGPRAPGGQVTDDQGPEQRADHHREQPQPETEAECDRQRAREDARHVHLRREPHGEEPAGAAVALVCRNGRDAVRLHRQIARAGRPMAGEDRPGQRGGSDLRRASLSHGHIRPRRAHPRRPGLPTPPDGSP